MPDIEFWKLAVSLGVPGLALGVFYMLLRSFHWKFPSVPQKWVGPIVVLFILVIAGVILTALVLWAPPGEQSGLKSRELQSANEASGEILATFAKGAAQDASLHGVYIKTETMGVEIDLDGHWQVSLNKSSPFTSIDVPAGKHVLNVRKGKLHWKRHFDPTDVNIIQIPPESMFHLCTHAGELRCFRCNC